MYNNMTKQEIESKILEFFELKLSGVMSVGISTKITNGIDTGELCISVGVLEKKPPDKLSPDQIVPKILEIGSEIIKTDVIETEIIRALAGCDASTINNCYSWCQSGNCVFVGFPLPPFISPANRNVHRPIKGGISMTSQNNLGYVGTLGFLALDKETDALVGVTNLHVAIGKGFFTHYLNTSWTKHSEINNNIYQHGELPGSSPVPPNLKIGEVIRYKPLHWYPWTWNRNPEYLYCEDNICDRSIYHSGHIPTWAPTPSTQINKVDAAIFSITASAVNMANLGVSSEQLGISGTQYMPFATTAELDSLLSAPVKSSGRTSGVKGAGSCNLYISQTNWTGVISYKYQRSIGFYSVLYPLVPYTLAGNNAEWEAYAFFNDCFVIRRTISSTDPTHFCPYPIIGGDSGSAVISEIGGVNKIIGLVFAGSIRDGIVCRIDHIAEQLGIKAWTGQTPNFVLSKSFTTEPNRSINTTQSCGTQSYWQAGFSTIQYNCPP